MVVMRFPAKKNAGCPKHRAISRQEKTAFSTPVGLSWNSPPPPPESVRTGGRTLTSQPKFHRLPNLLSNGAPLARYNIAVLNWQIDSICGS